MQVYNPRKENKEEIIRNNLYLKAGVWLYLASKDNPRTLDLSWLVAMTTAAERVAATAMSLNTRVQSLFVLAMDSTMRFLGAQGNSYSLALKYAESLMLLCMEANVG